MAVELDIFTIKEEEKCKVDLYTNPFFKNCFNHACIWISRNYNGKIEYSSDMEFKNQYTEGKQRFKGENLAELVMKMDLFMKSLEEI